MEEEANQCERIPRDLTEGLMYAHDDLLGD